MHDFGSIMGHVIDLSYFCTQGKGSTIFLDNDVLDSKLRSA